MTTPRRPIRSRELLERLDALPAATRHLVGFSGGADSSALLTALHRQRGQLAARVEAIHFDHGLHDQSAQWRQHCERFCSDRDIPLTCHRLELKPGAPNLENRARELRYRCVERLIDEETLYLTAHHADDRAETLLLHALRGSGVDGLASIPELRPLGAGHVARPLLHFSRETLRDYLRHHGIDWIEDPSNADSDPDRNFVRNEVLPLLQTRWAKAGKNLAESAALLDATNSVLREMLGQHLAQSSASGTALPRNVLFGLGEQGAPLVLREWLRRRGAAPPPRARLTEFLAQVANPADDARCELAWSDTALRLYRDTLRLVDCDESPACPILDWNAGRHIELGRGLGGLHLRGNVAEGRRDWVIGPRRPGDRIRLHDPGPRRKMKKIMQEQAIPPWQRNTIPVLYWAGEPVAVGDWLFAPRFEAWLGARKLVYSWKPQNTALCATRANCHRLQEQA